VPPRSCWRDGWSDLSRVPDLARHRRADLPGERTEQERERAREERERRRLERSIVTPPRSEEPPLPPPLPEEPLPDPASEESLPDAISEEPLPAPLPEEPLSAPVSEEPLYVSPSEEPSLAPIPEEPLYASSSEEPSLAPIPEEPLFAPLLEESLPPLPREPSPQSPGQDPILASSSPPPRRPHLHRPHLPSTHVSPPRRKAARLGALLALLVVLGGLVVGAVLLVHRSERPKIPPPPAIVKVVIPEGFTRAQIASLARADGLRGSYLLASKRSAQLRPSHYGAPAATPDLEGFLFPATYDLDVGAPASRLVSEQLTAFNENFGGAEVHRARVLGVTPYQLLIVASIVEREAGIPRDRRLVAAVIYNRLHQDMTLGIDATLRYALHDFTHPLTETELASASPYNTRIHKGLPPIPISNPGAAAIAAAARPAHVSYLYYVAGADGCGEQVFSTSYAAFEKNAAAYREALRRNGGRVPTCRKK
jgi:UPF0755 protein